MRINNVALNNFVAFHLFVPVTMADSDSEAFESADEDVEEKKPKKGEIVMRLITERCVFYPKILF